MTQSSVRVSDVVAEFLDRCGVNTAFGIISVHNAPLMEAIHRRNALRFIMVRGEMGGAHMADGYARASASLGVTFSSTGPGAGSGLRFGPGLRPDFRPGVGYSAGSRSSVSITIRSSPSSCRFNGMS